MPFSPRLAGSKRARGRLLQQSPCLPVLGLDRRGRRSCGKKDNGRADLTVEGVGSGSCPVRPTALRLPSFLLPAWILSLLWLPVQALACQVVQYGQGLRAAVDGDVCRGAAEGLKGLRCVN